MTATIDPLTLPIVARCDERERLRRAEQERRDEIAFHTAEVSRQIHQRRLDIATLDAAVAWARGPSTAYVHSVLVGRLDPGGILLDSPEASDLRARVLLVADGAA